MTISHTLACAALTACAATVSLAAPHAHQHGVARLDIAVESRKISLQLESPLDNLLGFERAPRTDAERRLADAAIARLRNAATVFVIDPAAQCTLAAVALDSAALKLGTPDPAEAGAGHADLDGSFDFDCVDATKAKYVEVALFDFAGFKRFDVQVATPQGQFKRSVSRTARRVSLTR